MIPLALAFCAGVFFTLIVVAILAELEIRRADRLLEEDYER